MNRSFFFDYKPLLKSYVDKIDALDDLRFSVELSDFYKVVTERFLLSFKREW